MAKKNKKHLTLLKPILKNRLFKTIAISAIVLYFLFGGKSSLLSIMHMKSELSSIESSITRSHAEIDSLTKEIERLKSDTAYIEQLAREKLGMARKDEKIFKFVDKE